jgi:hypothetical protein
MSVTGGAPKVMRESRIDVSIGCEHIVPTEGVQSTGFQMQAEKEGMLTFGVGFAEEM